MNSIEELEEIYNKWGIDNEKFEKFFKFFLEHFKATKIKDPKKYEPVIQITKDLIILDENLDDIGFDTLVYNWEALLDIKYGIHYKFGHNMETNEIILIYIQ